VKKVKGDGVVLHYCKGLLESDLHAIVRALVEHQFARFKKFKCLSTAWRHELWQHHRAFRAVAQLVQLDLLLEAEFKPHPAVVRTDTDNESEVDEDMEVDHEKQ
jgi:hypothetical protein